MSRKPPPPETQFLGFGAFVGSLWSTPFVLLWLAFDSWWLLVFAIPIALYVLHLVYGILLLDVAW